MAARPRASHHVFCSQQNELSGHAIEVLGQIARISQEQIQALRSNDQAAMMRLDRQLELLFGEKERAFGALAEHRREHGC